MKLSLLTRKQFFYSLGALAALPVGGNAGAAETGQSKVLLVVAHPDDEYAFAATAYRISKELHGTVDQVVITNGEAGFRYSQLAEAVYGVDLTREQVGRSRLPEIRKRETLAAGRIMGVRRHWFLEQKDARYTLDRDEALRIWDTQAITSFLTRLIAKEQYSYIFVLLPTADTHGHHQAAAELAMEAADRLPVELRPVVLGGDPAKANEPVRDFASAIPGSPVFRFDRRTAFGPNHSLSYQIIVNWVIAEHKSQGLFQTDFNTHDEERFWILSGGAGAIETTKSLFAELQPGRVAHDAPIVSEAGVGRIDTAGSR